MAKVQAQVVGGSVKIHEDMETVGEVRAAMNIGANYSVTVNGEPADDEHELADYEFVAFAPQVKGA